jgi:hypothetical protein
MHLQKDIFFNHVSSSKWGQIMFKVASQLSCHHCFHKIDEIVFHSIGLELDSKIQVHTYFLLKSAIVF